MQLGGGEREQMEKAGPYTHVFQKHRQNPQKWAVFSDCPLLVSYPLPSNAGNPLYSNVLYKPRRAPRKSEAWPVEGKVLDIPREDQNGQSFYSISLPQHPTAKQHLAPKSCPRPSPPISVFRVSPASGASGQPREFLEARKGIRTPRDQRGPPQRLRKDATDSSGSGSPA